jgi:hypothetical protein
MTREKYVKLREKRLKERDERLKKQRERIKAQREKERATRLRKWAQLAARKSKIEEQLEKARLEQLRQKKARLEEEKRQKARQKKAKLERKRRKKATDAIESAKTAAKQIEEETEMSVYVPEITTEITKKLADANNSLRSADYGKAIKLSNTIIKLAEKARLEALRKAEEKRRRRKKEAKYLYCIIPDSEEKSFGNMGINDKEVYTIPYRKVAAVVSDSPMKDYETTEDNIRKHETILREIMKEHTIVPAEFSTVIKNERILTHLLKKAYDPARECLKLVDNMAELGVKAVLNHGIVFAAPEKKKECISDILTSLNTTAKQAVTGEIFSDKLLLNASFMVNKEDINKFSKAVTNLQEKYPMLKLLYSGPWAPYNFVHIKIGAQGMEITKNR